MNIVARVGDVDPIEHGGGVIFESPEGELSLEYLRGIGGPERTVYQVPIPEDVLDFYNWIEVENISSFGGLLPSEIRKMSTGTPQEKAGILMLVATYYGWSNLDSYPLKLSEREVEQRWKL